MTLTFQGMMIRGSLKNRPRVMIATSTVRVIVPALGLLAACGGGIVFALTHARHERSVQAEVMPTGSPRLPGVENPDVAGLAQAQAVANAVMGALSPPEATDIPAFDISRIGPAGDAVIAGRAAPGTTVELMLDGKVLDQAIADQSGQFVMTPPRLPPGDYELTLRTGQRDGKQVTSKRSVLVALHPSPSDPSQAYQLASSATPIAEPRKSAVTGEPQAPAAATPLSERRFRSVKVARKMGTTVVAGGDSLWSISLAKYGNGEQYSVIYEANRNQIRDPDRIFPGQRIVIPDKSR
jgi:nucleoid-associated protein YgaU